MRKRLFCLLTALTLILLQAVCLGEDGGQAAGTWICPSCGESNTGTFCEECGTPKPGWVCVCGSHNEKKFCPVCGRSYETLSETYTQAVTAYGSGRLQEAAQLFDSLKGFNDSETYLAACLAAMPSTTPAPMPGAYDYDNSGYNPASEEGGQDEQIHIDVNAGQATPGPTEPYTRAGATPLVIDPINKPTPTPAPKVEFKAEDYTTYEAAALHLSFQGPNGWILEGPVSWQPDSGILDAYTLTNPDQRMSYAAQVRIRVVPVNKQYSRNELRSEVLSVRDALREELGFSSFDKYDTAGYNFLKVKNERGKYEFIKDKGVYTQYRGVLKENGTQVAGRIIICCYNKTLYILSCSYPGGELRESFEDVYRKVRDTLSITD